MFVCCHDGSNGHCYINGTRSTVIKGLSSLFRFDGEVENLGVTQQCYPSNAVTSSTFAMQTDGMGYMLDGVKQPKDKPLTTPGDNRLPIQVTRSALDNDHRNTGLHRWTAENAENCCR